MRPALVLSCEHGGNRVPVRLRPAFRGARARLESHEGWDPGALPLARELAREFGAPLVACTVTRLVVDTNRSATNPRVFSSLTRSLAAEERERLLATVWRPHRAAVERAVGARLQGSRPVLHLAVHSFAPRWPWPDGPERRVDAALLYDPSRPLELGFADVWIRALRAGRPDLRVRRNNPYRGTDDGLTVALRRRFDGRPYLGIELEVSQRFVLGPAAEWRRLRRELGESLDEALDAFPIST